MSLRSNLDKILDAISRQMVYEHLEWEIGSLEGSMGSVRKQVTPDQPHCPFLDIRHGSGEAAEKDLDRAFMKCAYNMKPRG